jgi:hypothetical protein
MNTLKGLFLALLTALVWLPVLIFSVFMFTVGKGLIILTPMVLLAFFSPSLFAMVLGIFVLGGAILLGLSKVADPYYGQNFESIKQQETGRKE